MLENPNASPTMHCHQRLMTSELSLTLYNTIRLGGGSSHTPRWSAQLLIE